jgi:hypothetical protein
VHLDDAQLEAGVLLRDELGRPREAVAEFERSAVDYPESTLRDDAHHGAGGDPRRPGRPRPACAALGELARRFPDSKHGLERAPSLRAKLDCH